MHVSAYRIYASLEKQVAQPSLKNGEFVETREIENGEFVETLESGENGL